MLALKAPAARLTGFLRDDVCVAAYNTPGLVVVAGEHDAIGRLEHELAAQSIACRRLDTSHAFHSPLMDAIVEPFQDLVRAACPRSPQQPWISSLTGTYITNEEAIDPAFWARQLRQPVRFSEGVRRLHESALVMLEVGPGRTLETFARQHGARRSGQPLLTTLPTTESGEMGELDHLLRTLGELWRVGCEVDWPAFNAGHRRGASRCRPIRSNGHGSG